MRSIRVVFCSLLLLAAAFAQGDRGAITGTVTDPVGALVPNAIVSLRNTETGSQHQTTTTETGNYSLPQLPAGIYELSVTVPGFSRYVQQGIRAQVASTVRVDVVLQVGAPTDSVTVTADAALLKTESAEISHIVSARTINALPLNFSARGPGMLRDPFTFVETLPGARIDGRNAIKVNGAPTTTFGVLLEGQDLSMPMSPDGSDAVSPSVDALQEITVQTSNYAAEYGQAGGGLFNFTTRSGTNAVHGSAYENLVNEVFSAGLPFTDNGSGGHVRPRIRKHDFGANLGGPVYIPKLYDGRQRTFFFANYEKYIDRKRYSGTYATVPTDAFRNGDFGAILTGRNLGTDQIGRAILENTIYNPGTTRVQNGFVVRDPFPNNVIPRNQIDPTAAKIQSYIPAATRAGQTNNFEQMGATERLNEITSIKIDHSFSTRNKLSFYDHYYRTKFANNGADGLPEPITSLRHGLARTHTVRITNDYSITPTFLLHAGVGMVRQRIPDQAVDGVLNYDSLKELGLKGAVGLGFPRITGLSGSQGGMSLGMGVTNAQVYYADKPSANFALSWVRGNHSYKLGGEWHRDIFANKNRNGSYGSYSFATTQTTLPSTQGQSLGGGSIGFAYASFLLGAANGGSISNASDPQYRKEAYGLFIQDSWKVTRRLTLDYGLRWDYLSAMHELWDRITAFAPNTRNPAAGNLFGATAYEGSGPGRCNCRFANTYPYALGPRLGAAYQLNAKTVLRGGAGITYARTADYNYMGPFSGVGYNTLNFSTTSFGDPALTFGSGMQYNNSDLYSSSFDPGLRPRAGQVEAPSAYTDRNGGRPPRTFQWSLSVQREIFKNLSVDAAYVGNRGAWFEANGLVDLNAITPARLQAFGLDINNANDRTLLTSRLDSTLAASRGFNKLPYAGYPASSTVAQSLRPYPQFTGVGTRLAPLGRTWYDSLQVKVNKRFSHGLELTSAFTWQKELSTLGPTNDVFNRANQKGLDGSSQPFQFVTSFNYTTPKFGHNRALRLATGGWTTSGVLRYASGALIGVPGSSNALSSLLFRGTRMNRVEGQPLVTADLNCHSCYDPQKDFVLNPKAWSDAAAGQWGYSAAYYNDYRDMRHPDEQLSLGRQFALKEHVSLSVRAEFFNVFNRLVLSGPSSGNPLSTQVRDPKTGVPTSGFGFINTATGLAGATANTFTNRSGQLVMRLQF
ncbi:MAG: TonB-dependent receptor [Candidatus Solibacter sp.]